MASNQKNPPANFINETETADPNALKDHLRNYREHPEDQLPHIIKSIQEHGFYKNIVIAEDGTILAGHGVVKAARKMGLKEVPVVRLPLAPDTPLALKVLAGDNEIPHLAEINDRILSEMLKEINDVNLDGDGLLGTGFDEMMLSNLVFVTRPAAEIENFDEAAHWVGMPDYEPEFQPFKLVISFETEEARLDFLSQNEFSHVNRKDELPRTIATWWPERERIDWRAAKFEVGATPAEPGELDPVKEVG